MSQVASEFFQSSDYLDDYKDSEQNAEEEKEIQNYVRNFEQQLQKKYQASETNKNYKFPRKKTTLKKQFQTKEEEDFFSTLQNASSYDIKSNDIKRYLQNAQKKHKQTNSWLAEVVFQLGKLDKNYLQNHFNKSNSKFLQFLSQAIDKHMIKFQNDQSSQGSQMPTKKRFLSKRKSEKNKTFNLSQSNFTNTKRQNLQKSLRNSTNKKTSKQNFLSVIRDKKKKNFSKVRQRSLKNCNLKNSLSTTQNLNKNSTKKKVKSMRISKKQSPLMLKKFKKKMLENNKKLNSSHAQLEKFTTLILNQNSHLQKKIFQKQKINQTNLHNMLQSRQKNKKHLNVEKKSLKNFLKKIQQKNWQKINQQQQINFN